MTTANAHAPSTDFAKHHAHHFESYAHQFSASKQGIWLFLATEILMFGVFFVTYGLFRGRYPEVFLQASQYLNTILGATNTVVLLFSSLTMALAIRSIQVGKNQRCIWFLFITFLCATTFMVIKYFEYTHKFHEGIFPGALYQGPKPIENIAIFFSLYYVMTGLHGIHVLVGMGLIAWLILKVKRGAFTTQYYTPVEGIGLYWHIVDIIWIFLFPLLYLI